MRQDPRHPRQYGHTKSVRPAEVCESDGGTTTNTANSDVVDAEYEVIDVKIRTEK